ncbi:hypothetical protein GCM10010442_29460 [Kitasatospora kifunensis]
MWRKSCGPSCHGGGRHPRGARLLIDNGVDGNEEQENLGGYGRYRRRDGWAMGTGVRQVTIR